MMAWLVGELDVGNCDNYRMDDSQGYHVSFSASYKLLGIQQTRKAVTRVVFCCASENRISGESLGPAAAP